MLRRVNTGSCRHPIVEGYCRLVDVNSMEKEAKRRRKADRRDNDVMYNLFHVFIF